MMDEHDGETCGTPRERMRMFKEMQFQDKCDTIAAGLLANLFKEIQLHHGNTKLARGIAKAVVSGLHEVDAEIENHGNK